MKKLLNKPWFVALLALGALVLVGNSVWQGLRGNSPAGVAGVADAAAPEPENETPAGDNASLPAADALKALVLPKAVLRDPFAHRERAEPAVAVVEKPAAPDRVESVHLSALWTQHGTTYTLINDRICQAGDQIGRLKIESATQDGVWLSHWKGRDFVVLGGDFILKTPAAVSTL